MRVARPKSPVLDFSGWATVSLLFGVLGEGNGILFEDVDELIGFLKKEPVSNHYILLKGSHSIHLEKAVDYL